MAAAWKPLGAAAPGKLAKAHLQPYQLAQWLARFARGYLEPAAADSHTSLQWWRDLHIMATGEARGRGRRLALGLNPGDLTLVTFVDGAIADEAPMHGLKDKAAGDWVRGRLNAFGLDPKALDAPSPYEVPPSPYAGKAVYDAQSDAVALAELSRYFDNADLLLRDVVDAHRHIRPGPAPVRLWPHHFDMAITIALEEGSFETARSVGVGLAVPDTLCAEFYWYAYPWPNASLSELKDLGVIAKYQTEGFAGALLPMSAAVGAEDQEAVVRGFFQEAVGFLMALLQKP